MIAIVSSVAIATMVSVGPVARAEDAARAPRMFANAAASAFSAGAPVASAMTRVAQNSSRDSLNNGAVYGAIVGGVLGALGGATGCGVGSLMDSFETETDCNGAAIVGAMVGAGLGSLVGVGIDAMFDVGPQPAAGAAGRRKGIRVRWRF